MTRLGVDPLSAEVQVEVVPDTCCDRSTKVQGYETGSVSFSCPYKSKYRNNMKYICRGNQPSTCLQQALITSDHKRSRQFTLTDDTASRKFTVTIKSLTQRDSGPYLCGVHRNTGLDVFSAVELEVKDLPKKTPLITAGPVSPTSQTTQISEKPTKVVALLLSLTFGLVMVYKYCKLQGVGVVMNRTTWKATEAEEMTAVVDIYGFEDDLYSHLDSYKQSTL
ncbi:CMRF35-like molecule 7 [Morone saxatilis]|uniref:CMRF35-like molecule 7 n=1 Tax=Morone saxatilis TaxID=34816 RepID=UPI0015E210EB|nr:CMRF35-like molecule 7 [Morone saxatilis]